MGIKSYVVGLLFAKAYIGGARVLLMRKARPAWQAGLLNGPGGMLRPGEDSESAMHREFEEETGLGGIDWAALADLKGDDVEVRFFSAWTEPEVFDAAQSLTDEMLERKNLADLSCSKLVAPLRVLIPLALDMTLAKPVQLNYAPMVQF